MADSTSPVLEGIFATHKPPTLSSAKVLEDLKSHFNPSSLFAPWLSAERSRLEAEAGTNRNAAYKSRRKKQQRKIHNLQVKLGHGGTLDPLATGVLIVGLGKGTKCLQRFLECTKTYETVCLFGAATDSYDAVGKIVKKAPYEHVTREVVEEALTKFRGKLLQRPPIFSAIKVQGMKLYEYARSGKEVPIEIQERPVEVLDLQMMEFLEPGKHEFKWPEEEAEPETKSVANKIMDAKPGQGSVAPTTTTTTKRKRSVDLDDDVQSPPPEKKAKAEEDEPMMSGALPPEDSPKPEPSRGLPAENVTADSSRQPKSESESKPAASTLGTDDLNAQPPAVRLRMTVTSGFYVRTLCHDLGAAVGSLGLMSSLVRTRQGDFELHKNVLEYEDLGKGEKVWGPKVKDMLQDWMRKEGWDDGECDELPDGEDKQSRAEVDRERKRSRTPNLREGEQSKRRRNSSSMEAES